MRITSQIFGSSNWIIRHDHIAFDQTWTTARWFGSSVDFISRCVVGCSLQQCRSCLGFCRQNETELIILEVRHEYDDLLKVVPEMKALCPQGNVLALIHDESDRQTAELAQVDRILSIGIPASKLKIEIEGYARTSEAAAISSEEEFE